MASEKFANLAETTLASDYTSGGSSISVASASGFPTDGVFRVRLGNAGKTIFRVDSVSGTTFTGAAEENDANATTGDTVKIVASRAAAERFIQSPASGFLHAPSGVSGADSYGPIWKLTPFVDSGWSWVNQGSATIGVTNGIGQLVVPKAASQQIRGRVKSFPSTNFTVEMLMKATQLTSSAQATMFGFRESGTGKIKMWRLEQSNHRISIGTTTISGDVSGTSAAWAGAGGILPAWLRIAFDNTNLTFSFSFDGVIWIQRLQVAKATDFTSAPDQIFFAAYDQGNVEEVRLSILSYREF